MMTEVHRDNMQDIAIKEGDEKTGTVQNVEHRTDGKDGHVQQQMRTKADDLPILVSLRAYKLVSLLAMTAAFCAALDGYRKFFSSPNFHLQKRECWVQTLS